MEKFTLNKRVYQAKELDFNFICILGENNIDLSDIGKKVLPAIRCYVAYCMDADVDVAGTEINAHVINGGKLEDIINVFNEKAEESDFFQALGKTETQETPTTKKSKKDTEA